MKSFVAAAVVALSVPVAANAQTLPAFQMRGVTADITEEQVIKTLPMYSSRCGYSCGIKQEWMPTIGGLKVKQRNIHYHITRGDLEYVELIVEIGHFLRPDLESRDRTTIREALTRHYGEPCVVEPNDGMFGHVSWCFEDGTLTETAWGEFESRILFTPSTPEQRAAEQAHQAELAARDF